MDTHDWELRDLRAAVLRVQSAGGKVTWDTMIEWKRGRGMRSSHDMSVTKNRVAWLRRALRYLETAGVAL